MMVFIKRTLDFVVAPFIVIFGISLWMTFFLVNRLRLRPPDHLGNLRWLTLTSGSHEANLNRNILGIYQECLLNGRVERCYFVYFLAPTFKKFVINAQIVAIDYRGSLPTRLDQQGLFFSSRLLQQFFFVSFLYRLVRRENVSVIQANDPILEGLAAWAVSRLTKVPFFVRAQCNYEHYFKDFGRLAFPVISFRSIERFLERFINAHADAIVPLNETCAVYARAMAAPPEKVIPIPSFFDRQYFDDSPRPTTWSPPFDLENLPIFIYLGRLSWDKYCLDLIDALAVVTKTLPKAKLVILGDGPLHQEMLNRADAAGLSNNIFIAGFCDVPTICQWVRHAHIAVASHGGFSLVEMGSVGIPIVAYDYEWHPEVLHEGKTGFLVPFRDGRKLGERAAEIFLDQELGKSVANRLRQAVRSRFHPDIVGDETYLFLRTLLRESTKRP